MRLDNFSISISSNIFFTILGIIILAAYSYYIYKYTIPPISPILKYILIIIRAAAIILLFFLIFEPTISIKSTENIKPETIVFVDNSNSIVSEDSISRKESIEKLISDISTVNTNPVIYTFGSKTVQLKNSQVSKINFSETSTNFSDIISTLNQSKANISSAIIISDGIINDGSDPLYAAEKLPYPIYTVGIGDTTHYKDVQIRDILNNQYIYAEKPTKIEVTTAQFGFDNQAAAINLYADNQFIASKNIQLNSAGPNKIQFDYTPSTPGEIKLKVSISSFKTEKNTDNNSKTFFINVLKNKVKIGLIAGSPSADVTAITNALESDKNFDIMKLIQVSENKFWNDLQPSIIDSADVLFLINFPSSDLPNSIYQKVFNNIRNKYKPFFYLLTPNTDLNELQQMNPILPFTISQISDEYLQVQPFISDNSLNGIFNLSSVGGNIWNDLPPVLITNSEITAKPGSTVLIKIKSGNTPLPAPLLLTRNIGNERSIALLAGDVWRWELSTAENYPEFFPNLIGEFVKWLSASDKQKQFSVRTSKKLYSGGEPIEFVAELYDQTFTPIDSANINVEVKNGSQSYNLIFDKEQPGIFRTNLESAGSGDYTYKATARFNGTVLTSSEGRFTIGETNIEKSNTRMNVNFLKLLANSTNGRYYFINNYEGMKDRISALVSSSSKDKVSVSELNLWSNEWIMFIIICLFAFEWIVRKREGML